MQFIDLAAQRARISDKIDRQFQRSFVKANIFSVPKWPSLSGDLADYVGVKHVVACANGTDAC